MFLTKFAGAVQILLALISSHLAYATSTFEPNYMCSLLPDKTKIKDPRACNTWIECIEGVPNYGYCDDDDFYDRETETCVPQNSIQCISSNPCAATEGTNGFVADPYSCNGYYYCNNGQAAHGTCQSGWNFNPGTQDCIRNFACAPKMLPENYCNIVPDGVFIQDPSSCNGYQLCWDGEVVDRTCPTYFYYNALTGKCDYPENVQCDLNTSTTPDLPVDELCSAPGLFVSDRLSCNGYYYCRESTNSIDGIELVHGTCPEGRFFDRANGGACVPRTSIVCKLNRCVGLGKDAIELANVSDDGCVGYSLCQDGEVIGAGVCPNDKYFDELSQRCTTEVIDFPACAYTGTSTEATTHTTV